MKQSLVYGKNHKGMALVSLLMFTLVAMTVITSTIMIVITNTRGASVNQQSVETYFVAESGIENALIRVLRNPDYTGETLLVGNNIATVTVNGSTITSIGQVGNLSRKIQVTFSYTNNQMTVVNWQEVP